MRLHGVRPAPEFLLFWRVLFQVDSMALELGDTVDMFAIVRQFFERGDGLRAPADGRARRTGGRPRRAIDAARHGAATRVALARRRARRSASRDHHVAARHAVGPGPRRRSWRSRRAGALVGPSLGLDRRAVRLPVREFVHFDAANANFSFDDVAVLSVESCVAPLVVTSAEVDERLGPVLHADPVPAGLVSLARRHPRSAANGRPGVSFTHAAAMAGERAIAAAGRRPLRDRRHHRHERLPGSARAVERRHRAPPARTAGELPELRRRQRLPRLRHRDAPRRLLIDSGQIDYALLVDGEGTRELYDNTIERLNPPARASSDLLANFATFTLGSGAAAMVLGRRSAHADGHRAAARLLPRRHRAPRVVRGHAGGWTTDSRALLDAGIGLAATAWEHAGTRERLGRPRPVHPPPGLRGAHRTR